MFLRFLEAGLLRTKSVSFPDLVVFSEMLLKKEAEDPFETKSSKFLEGRKTEKHGIRPALAGAGRIPE